MLCQYPPAAGVAGHLRLFYAYGCRFTNLGLVVVCHPVQEVRCVFGIGHVD